MASHWLFKNKKINVCICLFVCSRFSFYVPMFLMWFFFPFVCLRVKLEQFTILRFVLSFWRMTHPFAEFGWWYCVGGLCGCDSQLPVFGQIRLNVTGSKLQWQRLFCLPLNVQLGCITVLFGLFYWSFKIDSSMQFVCVFQKYFLQWYWCRCFFWQMLAQTLFLEDFWLEKAIMLTMSKAMAASEVLHKSDQLDQSRVTSTAASSGILQFLIFLTAHFLHLWASSISWKWSLQSFSHYSLYCPFNHYVCLCECQCWLL